MNPFPCIYAQSLLGLLIFMVSTCSAPTHEQTGEEKPLPGTYAADLEFLKQYRQVIELHNENSFVLLSTEDQGRVMTSSANGRSGYSFGWINYNLFSSPPGEKLHMHAYGGEDRFWLGPEGGQFSVYFAPGTPFEFAHWFVPDAIDTEPFTLLSNSESEAVFVREIHLNNHSGNNFDLDVRRTIRILSPNISSQKLGISLPKDVNMVGFESENQITNSGENAWTKESGALSVWILTMLKPSPETTIAIPLNQGSRKINDAYFGKIPADRLLIGDHTLLMKADGKYRSKIGIPPGRNSPYAGSYDAQNHVLTIVSYTIHPEISDYVNSMWERQESPFGGDVVNAYNDGPLEDGSQMGPFYELETSSPAAFLAPGESMIHVHSTFHFSGEPEALNGIAEKVLGISIESITTALTK
ncbi:MAG: DUF6786 family protein [Bacteroidia bacterium]